MTIALIIIACLVAVLILTVLVFWTSADRRVLLSRQRSFAHDGVQRSYLAHIPSKLSSDAKLIVGLHGFGDSPRRFAYYTALHNAAPNDIVVYPQALTPGEKGIRPGWNALFCCGSGWVAKADDVGFITALAQSLAQEHGISSDKIYATGFSNGALMTQRLAAERPDVFAAIASVAGSIGTTNNQLQPLQPVPILLMHGQRDKTVPFAGGASGSDRDFVWQSFDQTAAVWQQINGDSAPVETLTFPQRGHSWPGWRILNLWTSNPHASQTIVNFFDDYSADL